MSRRARAVELWASLKYLGRRGIDDLVYGLHERAVQLGSELRAEGFEILNDIVFNQVLGAQWLERSVIRVSVCSWATTPDDISRSVKAFVAARGEAR
jgi:glutamate/tyrosine decarboxylase-like PLP-dependent enzyme